MKTEKDIINQFPYEPRNNSKEALRKMLKQEQATKYVIYSVIGIAILLLIFFFADIVSSLVIEWKQVGVVGRASIITIVVISILTMVTLLSRRI
jgi:hypothetical protein